MTDWRLEALRRQLRDAKAERDHLDQQAERAERIGIPELAARYRIGREEPHFRAFHEQAALDEPPERDMYVGEGLIEEGKALKRLARIGVNRPGHLISSVRTELNIVARTHPDLAERGRAVLDGIDPEDRRFDVELVIARQALGRLVTLGWPRRQATAAIKRLEQLR